MPIDTDFEVYVLDMGRQMYGDCVLIKSNSTTIIVDGGHAGDFKGQYGYRSIPAQLEKILGPPPFSVDLLIVTHCHSDHIGCLPDLVSSGLVRPRWALVADEGLGFGRQRPDSKLPSDGLPDRARALVASLQEEDRSRMTDGELAEFLVDMEKLESRYDKMLADLKPLGDRLIRFGRQKDYTALEREFEGIGFKILGPEFDHLAICAEAIQRANADATSVVENRQRTDLINDLDLYRSLAAAKWSVDLLDMPGKGAALNNQSIVFKIGDGDRTALFAGDMQFGKPEVTGLGPLMKSLRETISEAGPYQFAKLTHHTSYNGINAAVLGELGDPKFLVHTGGLNDSGHPDPGSLHLLEKREQDIKFARTDRNGLIKFSWTDGFTLARNELNDFSRNVGNDEPEESAEGGEATTSVKEPEISPPEPKMTSQSNTAPGTVEVLFMRIPGDVTKITIAGIPIEIERSPPRDVRPQQKVKTEVAPRLPTEAVHDSLAAGRKLPPLLFVTQQDRLARKIGEREAARALDLVRKSGQTLLDLPTTDDVADLRGKLSRGNFKGVVILGGYDVLPSERVDVLDADLRRQIGRDAADEPDKFVVWSDDKYGDSDGDGIAEFPVSRIPDGNLAEFFIKCLKGASPAGDGRFGIRNSERPFADAIWQGVRGTENILISGPTLHSELARAEISRPSLYFMLHGHDVDATQFWGEDNGVVEAIKVSSLPRSDVGVVFAGCCWGALIVEQKASSDRGPLGARSPGQSMALSFLMSGANAFVGCTGAHYSPNAGENFFSEPLHREFWKEFATTESAAEALFNARKTYLGDMPHGLSRPYHLGIERKLYKQFTCLGLGW
ncbi:MBL fold metallo-hydrolase [Rhizobium leguminosarum]